MEVFSICFLCLALGEKTSGVIFVSQDNRSETKLGETSLSSTLARLHVSTG
jgi:hypothetical protein